MLKNVSQNNSEYIPVHLCSRKCTTGQEFILRIPHSPVSRFLPRLTGLKLNSLKKFSTEVSQTGLDVKQAVFGILLNPALFYL